MADEGEDTESLQGLLPPEVDKSPEGSGESGRSGGGGCEGLEGPFLTKPGSQEGILAAWAGVRTHLTATAR